MNRVVHRMFMLAIAFFSGIITVLQFSFLPAAWVLFLTPILALLLVTLRKSHRILLSGLIFVTGALWAIAYGHYILSSELADDLQGRDLIVTGTVSSLPEVRVTTRGKRNRFLLDVLRLTSNGVDQAAFPKRIRISWYGDSAADVRAGEQWQFKVRLKQPHGMLNPGGFDYEKWLFERKIRATGYVRNSEHNQRVAPASIFSVNAYRESLKNKLMGLMPDSEYRGIVLALSLGDKSQISDAQWQVFTATGTNHLLAISGLHIGLVAAAFYFMAGFVAKRFPCLLVRFPYYKIAALAAVVSAFFYAMLAGFAIPTQRALVMISVVMLFMMIDHRINARTILSTALVTVLIVDPFSVLAVGFWLSFIAVAAILYAMQNRASANSLWWRWGRLQWIVSVALIPALLVSFQTFSIISPLANMIAVPWVSFFVVPLVLLSAVLSFVTPLAVLADGFLWFVDNLLHYLWQIMEYLATLPYAQWQQFSPQTWTLLPAVIGVLLMLSPKGFPAKYLSVFFFLPLFIVKPLTPAENQFSFTLLDVGQGLAAVVQTRSHVLVYDTGARFASGFDMGEAVVLPFLRNIAASKIDTLVISHGDNDHIGGLESILQGINVGRIVTSVPEKISPSNLAGRVNLCLSGQAWQWDGVQFEFLNPDSMNEYANKRKRGNNRSCVLKVSSTKHSVLLTGDIEKAAEKKLLRNSASLLAAKIMVAPHHGSNSSSTAEFIEAVKPDYVLFPAGYRNRYGFPKPNVMARYEQQAVKSASTAVQGAISFDIDTKRVSKPNYYRQEVRRFWHH